MRKSTCYMSFLNMESISTSSSNSTQKIISGEDVNVEKYPLSEYYDKLQSLENDLALSRQSLCHVNSSVSKIKEILNSLNFENLQKQMEKPLDNAQVLSVNNPEKFSNLLHLSSDLFCNIQNFTIDGTLPNQLLNGLEKVNSEVGKIHEQALEMKKNFIDS
ncbi:uncharacterized protein LOC106666780 [Cimex lectularius]|uniref:Uncharacterized protein n=1 Tax=Cimex lectularius TaxID=79782 RepID=A0A8I6TEJ6_CIMLE|nr:uncharacterized protein LOC106666780 [Cimex lectularius]